MQMRRLDCVREGMLCKVWNELVAVKAELFQHKAATKVHRRYKGRPFSYFGFLEKAARPTNMAYRRKILLRYSEL